MSGGGGQSAGYGPSYGQSNAYMGGGGYGGYGGGYGQPQYGYGNQYGGGQYNPQARMGNAAVQYPMAQKTQPFMPGQMTLGSTQQAARGIRAQPQSLGISGLPYQPVGGVTGSRTTPQTTGGNMAPSMNAGGNMFAQAPADSRGMAQVAQPQPAPMAQQAPQPPAWTQPGWVNPMFSQANNAYPSQQNAMQSEMAPQNTTGQGMGGEMFTGQKAYPEGYQFESVPSTLDPGSMAGLIGWMGGSNSPYGPTIGQQTGAYNDFYRQTYGQQAPGGPTSYLR